MAILEGIKGLEAIVHVSGRGISKEFVDREETTPRRASNYIEAVTGAEFSVNYRFTSHFESKELAFAINVYIDGKYMNGHLLDSYTATSGDYTNCFFGTRDENQGQWQSRKFAFSKLVIRMYFL